MYYSRRSGKRHTLGFTYYELALVVGIIGIMSSIALPSFLDTRKKHREQESFEKTVQAEGKAVMDGQVSDLEQMSFIVATGNNDKSSQYFGFNYSIVNINGGRRVVVPYQTNEFRKGERVNFVYTPDDDGIVSFDEIVKYGSKNLNLHLLEPVQKGQVEADGIYQGLELKAEKN